MSSSDIISVIAALLAAGLSAITLLVTVRREERRWRRDTLVGTIVQFMDGSFKLPGNRAYRLLVEGKDMEAVHASAYDGFHECATALTRLRILAPNEVVERAEILHDIDDRITELLLVDSEDLPPRAEWLSLADQRMAARTALLDAARKGLGLGPAKPFVPTRHRIALTDSLPPGLSSDSLH